MHNTIETEVQRATGPWRASTSRWTARTRNDGGDGSAVDAAQRHRPEHRRERGRRRGKRLGHHGADRRQPGPALERDADRVRVRPDVGVPAAAGDVPVDRDPDQGHRAEPAVRRRRLRRPDVHLPARPPRGAARLPLERRGGDLAAAVHVRGAVRPVDGLPRVHPQPGPRGRGPGHAHRGRGRPTGSRARPAWSRAQRS